MRDSSTWSINLGHWRGVHVRLHAFFLVFGLLAFYLSTRAGGGDDLALYAVLGVLILFISVLAHEAGHCFAALQVGGQADEIVLAPIGGLAHPQVPREPQHELITALAGPMVNFGIWLLTAPLLVAWSINLLGLLHPFHPTNLVEGSVFEVVLKLTFWINWLLVLVNLLPVSPLDGYRALRALLWPALGYRTAVLVVTRGSKIVAVGLCILAWLVHDPSSSAVVPAWLPLGLLAILLFFSAKQEAAKLEDQELDEELFAYDFSQGYTSLEPTPDAPHAGGLRRLRRWFKERGEHRQRQQRMLEQDDDRRVDEILARLHECGLTGLTPHERALLERVSARYRSRQQS